VGGVRAAGHLRGTCQCGQVDFRLAAAESLPGDLRPRIGIRAYPADLGAGSGRSGLCWIDMT
jgi:hypothetical protein